jgi:glycosyltransferase involved in cell wall biosynthesis
MEKIRILHCLETIGPGGVEQRRLSIARYLNHDQFDQVLTCSKVIGSFDRKLIQAGTPVKVIGVLGSLFNFGYYKRLIKEVRLFKPHIIHGAVFEGVISAVVGGIFGRVPIIIIEETSEPINRSWRGHFLFRLLSMFADAVVATSPAVYDYITQVVKISKSKTHLIVNGAELPLEPEAERVKECRTTFDLPDTDFIVGSVGRMLDNTKLFSVLIKAFAEFQKNKPDSKLILVGDGTDKEMLVQLSMDLGIGSKTIFAGHQRDVRPFYKAMNLFVLSSSHEGFGMAAVEAMFFGLPVVATRVGGLKQIVVDGETGILIEAGQVTELCEAITYLYHHPKEATQMGIKGKQRAYEKYSAERYVKDVEMLYLKLSDQG